LKQYLGETMKVTRITIVVVWALTVLLFPPLAAKASVQGVGQSSHFKSQLLAHNHRHQNHRAFGLWPYGDYDVPSYAPDTYAAPEAVVAEPTPSVGCKHSEQIVEVPSENGGVREVTILRC